jgi:crotonobetainyl-CoA:carnitine CoA-transferase CaiB-like acyl-CoA transferase
VADEDFGTIRMQNVVPRFTNDPSTIRSPGRQPGFDNETVFKQWLGLSERAIKDLKHNGTI